MSTQKSPPPAPSHTSGLLANMLAGALGACIAEAVTIPIDSSKVRLQLQTSTPAGGVPYKGMANTIYRIATEEGAITLYRGLTPGLQRQFANCSVRFGAYEHVRNWYAGPPDANGKRDVTGLGIKIKAAATTGIFAIFFANPMDVVKVRMQTIAKELAKKGGDAKMPSSNTVYSEIYKNEGFSGFYRGIQPNIFRNVCVNVGEMASYDQFKQLFLTYTSIPDNIFLHIICGFMAGFCATVIASPADVVKTRLMSSPDSYSGVFNAFNRMVKEEGPGAFYKGFIPNFMRLSLWSITCFVAMEQFKILFGSAPAKPKKE